MPIDASIALGVKPIQFESPVNQMVKMYEMQNMQQSNQLNQMKMSDLQRASAKEENLNALVGGFTPDMNDTDKYNALLRGGHFAEAKAFNESAAKANADKRAAESAQLDNVLKEHTVLGKYLDSVIASPTLANATSTVTKANAVLKHDPTDDLAELNAIGENPEALRQWAITHKGALDMLKTSTKYEDVGGYKQPITTDYFGKETFGKGLVKTQTPDSVASGVIQTRGQNLTDERARERIALDERRVKVAETVGAPGYVKPLTATQQYKLDKLKTADKTNAKLFDSSIDAELKNIDKLIGTEDKPKLHAGLASATGPIASRIFTGRTDTANAEAYIKSLQSKASINSLQTIRGTAGAIGTMTEREWPRLESMKATLQETQGTDQFVQSLIDYRNELKNMKLKSKEALNTDYSTEIGASANPNIDALLQKYPD
jgi:hypothetical protein